MRIEVTEQVTATPEAVWDLVADISRMGEWSPETTKAVWIDGAVGATVGARFKGTNRRGVARWSTRCQVIDAIPGEVFTFRVGKGPTTWSYRMAAVGDGCRVTETAQIPDDLGRAERLLFRVMGVKDRAGDLRRGMQDTLARLKVVAEAAAMRIALGSDHAGFALKQVVLEHLIGRGDDVVDCGTYSEERVDYPVFCAAAARTVVAGDADRAFVFGGSGNGEQMAANKVPGARAALCHDEYTARLARQHNDANVCSIGARVTGVDVALAIVDVFLDSTFDGGRHVQRIAQLAELDRRSSRPSPPTAGRSAGSSRPGRSGSWPPSRSSSRSGRGGPRGRRTSSSAPPAGRSRHRRPTRRTRRSTSPGSSCDHCDWWGLCDGRGPSCGSPVHSACMKMQVIAFFCYVARSWRRSGSSEHRATPAWSCCVCSPAHPDLDVAYVGADSNAGIAWPTSPRASPPPTASGASRPSTLRARRPRRRVLRSAARRVQHAHARSRGKVGHVVDLGADFRLKDAALYPEWYGEEHPCPELLGKAAFGIPELFRSRLQRRAAHRRRRLLRDRRGAGARTLRSERRGRADRRHRRRRQRSERRRPGAEAEPALLRGRRGLHRLRASHHRHTPEIEQATGAQVLFTPHLAPMNRGILATVYARPDRQPRSRRTMPCTSYETYEGEPFVVVSERSPSTKATLGSNTCHLTARVDPRTGWVARALRARQPRQRRVGSDDPVRQHRPRPPETTGLPLVGLHP